MTLNTLYGLKKKLTIKIVKELRFWFYMILNTLYGSRENTERHFDFITLLFTMLNLYDSFSHECTNDLKSFHELYNKKMFAIFDQMETCQAYLLRCVKSLRLV